MFAKIFTIKHGQMLLHKFEGDVDGPCQYGLKAMVNIPSPFGGSTDIVTQNKYFGDTAEGEENRDRVFAAFDQESADNFAKRKGFIK